MKNSPTKIISLKDPKLNSLSEKQIESISVILNNEYIREVLDYKLREVLVDEKTFVEIYISYRTLSDHLCCDIVYVSGMVKEQRLFLNTKELVRKDRIKYGLIGEDEQPLQKNLKIENLKKAIEYHEE